MHTVIVTFTLNGLDHDAFERTAAEIAPAFAGVPGLRAKLWLSDAPARTYGGVYLFETAAAAEEYLASDLFGHAVIDNPALGDVTVRRADTIDAATAITTPALGLPAAA